MPYDDERWGAKFKVMKENIEHHIEEEEKRDVHAGSPGLRGGRAQALGERMKVRKDQMTAA